MFGKPHTALGYASTHNVLLAPDRLAETHHAVKNAAATQARARAPKKSVGAHAEEQTGVRNSKHAHHAETYPWDEIHGLEVAPRIAETSCFPKT